MSDFKNAAGHNLRRIYDRFGIRLDLFKLVTSGYNPATRTPTTTETSIPVIGFIEDAANPVLRAAIGNAESTIDRFDRLVSVLAEDCADNTVAFTPAIGMRVGWPAVSVLVSGQTQQSYRIVRVDERVVMDAALAYLLYLAAA